MFKKSIITPFFILQGILIFLAFYYIMDNSLLYAVISAVLLTVIQYAVSHRGMKKQQRKEDEEYAKKWGLDVSDL